MDRALRDAPVRGAGARRGTGRPADGVHDIALGTSDAAAAYREALRRGATPASPPRLRDGVVTASIVGFGDVTHTFIQRLPTTDAQALPGLAPSAQSPAGTEESTGLCTIDHFAVCLEAGQLLPTVACYEQVLGFRTARGYSTSPSPPMTSRGR